MVAVKPSKHLDSFEGLILDNTEYPTIATFANQFNIILLSLQQRSCFFICERHSSYSFGLGKLKA